MSAKMKNTDTLSIDEDVEQWEQLEFSYTAGRRKLVQQPLWKTLCQCLPKLCMNTWVYSKQEC